MFPARRGAAPPHPRTDRPIDVSGILIHMGSARRRSRIVSESYACSRVSEDPNSGKQLRGTKS